MQQNVHKGVVEIAIFRTREGVTHEHLLGTVDAVSAWAQEQPGFISRDLTYSAENDTWIDVIWWETFEAAHQAMQLAETSESCTPMFSAIEMESIQMLHGERVIPTVTRTKEIVGAQ